MIFDSMRCIISDDSATVGAIGESERAINHVCTSGSPGANNRFARGTSLESLRTREMRIRDCLIRFANHANRRFPARVRGREESVAPTGIDV